MQISRRGKKGTFQLFRRIPKKFKPLSLGTFFRKSLHTENRQTAETKAKKVWDLKLAEWEALLAGRNDEAAHFHRKLTEIADHMGFEYLPASEVADGPLPEIVKRLSATNGESPVLYDAVLGASDRQSIFLSELFHAFDRIKEPDNRQKSEAQKKKWDTNYERALERFLSVTGDRAILTLTRSDALRLSKGTVLRIAFPCQPRSLKSSSQ